MFTYVQIFNCLSVRLWDQRAVSAELLHSHPSLKSTLTLTLCMFAFNTRLLIYHSIYLIIGSIYEIIAKMSSWCCFTPMNTLPVFSVENNDLYSGKVPAPSSGAFDRLANTDWNHHHPRIDANSSLSITVGGGDLKNLSQAERLSHLNQPCE